MKNDCIPASAQDMCHYRYLFIRSFRSHPEWDETFEQVMVYFMEIYVLRRTKGQTTRVATRQAAARRWHPLVRLTPERPSGQNVSADSALDFWNFYVSAL